MTEDETTRDPRAPTTASAQQPLRWLNGAVTGTLLASVLVASLEHGDLGPDPVYDIAWIVITLAGTGLIRGYSSFVASRSRREGILGTILRILPGECSLVVAGVPAVAILLGSTAGWYPTLTAIQAVLITNVLLLLGCGCLGASQAGYRRLLALVIGFADASVGMLVILANALLK